MSENMITSPTTESTDDLLSHGICMAADIIFVNNNNISSNSNCNNNTTNNNGVGDDNDVIIDDNNDNCKLLRVNGSALNGDGGEDGEDNSNTVKSMDSNHHHNSQPERSIESGSSSSSSLSNSSSSSSTGTSTSSTSSSSSSVSSSLISQSKSLPVTEAAWVCKLCEFSHKWPLIMINHLRIFHKLQSPFDQYIFKQNNSLTTESSSSELVTYQPTSTNIKCKLCDIAFETDQDLEEHNEHLHSDLVWACKSCSFSNKWQQLAISHLRSAHNCHPPYTDHLYRKNSDKSSSLLQQIKSASLNFRSHLYPPPPPPPPPSRSLQPSPQPQKKQHQIQSAKETPQVKSKPRQTPTPPQQKPITVSFTLKETLPENANSFIEHLISDDSNSSNYDTNEEIIHNESKMKTETVPESQSSGVEMAPGLKTATKDCYRRLDNDRFQCTNCGKTCGSAQGITEHYEAYHLGLNYQCKLCGFTDLWRSMLTKHLKVKHLMGKPYEKYLRRVKVEPGLDVYQANSTKHWRRRFRQQSLDGSPDPVSSPKKARQASSSSTTPVPTSSSATTSNNKKRNSNSIQEEQEDQEQEEEEEEKEEEDEVEEPKVVIPKRGRKPKDTSAVIKVKAKSKRRRLKQVR